MPRSRGSAPASRAPSRPSVAPSRPAAPPPQNRSASTAAHPPAQQAPPQQQQSSGGSGLFGQMASTAAGVAVGSSIGHAIGGFFGGGSSAPAEQSQVAAAPVDQNNQYSSSGSQYGAANCSEQTKSFTQCLDQNQGNMQICGWYLEQLKACQASASPY